jgi:restriction system protein
MTLWVVKAGRSGERESRILENSVVGIGWEDIPDLTGFGSREQLAEAYRAVYPGSSDGRVYNQVGQLWAFSKSIQRGDWVVVPLKTRGAIAIGEIISDYEYRRDLGVDMLHTRRVRWIETEIPRASFDRDLLFTFGSAMTVSRAERHDAENRVKALVEGHAMQPIAQEPLTEENVPDDIEQVAQDQILEFISAKFRGHDFARLVDAVLQAQGMDTKISPPGPDGGVDILAGSGPLGFEPPRLCVQVKSSDAPVDVTVFRSLVGTMQAFSADYGLLVAWGGFKRSVYQEAQSAYFSVRLWDATQVVQSVFEYYDRLAESMRAELPLKRIWALALEEPE